jgi:uncharacterized protein YciI
MSRYVLLYESAEDVARKAPAHFPAHRARWQAFRDAGTLLQIGTFADVQAHGSMAILTSGEAAREFAEGDPFVLEGVVARWEIREWNEALQPDE